MHAWFPIDSYKLTILGQLGINSFFLDRLRIERARVGCAKCSRTGIEHVMSTWEVLLFSFQHKIQEDHGAGNHKKK